MRIVDSNEFTWEFSFTGVAQFSSYMVVVSNDVSSISSIDKSSNQSPT